MGDGFLKDVKKICSLVDRAIVVEKIRKIAKSIKSESVVEGNSDSKVIAKVKGQSAEEMAITARRVGSAAGLKVSMEMVDGVLEIYDAK